MVPDALIFTQQLNLKSTASTNRNSIISSFSHVFLSTTKKISSYSQWFIYLFYFGDSNSSEKNEVNDCNLLSGW